jgi:L-lactate dehydrogenase
MSKVAIIGAGVVGTTIAYAVMMRGVAREIVLVDTQAEKARAEAMDLNHGAMFVPPVAIADGPIAACAGADVVVITAGAKQRPGQSRLDLVSANAAVFRTLIPEIVKAAPTAQLLVVSNPVDVLTDVALRLSGLPLERVLGSGTVLDTSRFRFLLSRHFDVSVSNVHAYIIGEHGDSEVPLWSSAQIGAVPLADLHLPGKPPVDTAARRAILEEVRGAAGTVIRAKGVTNWAVGLAVARILEALLRDERIILTVTRRLQDYQGVSDVCLSIPWLVTGRGAESFFPVPFDPGERAAFQRSAEVVRDVIRQLGF